MAQPDQLQAQTGTIDTELVAWRISYVVAATTTDPTICKTSEEFAA